MNRIAKIRKTCRSKAYREAQGKHSAETWKNPETRKARIEGSSRAQKGKKFTKKHLANLRKANAVRSKEHCASLSLSIRAGFKRGRTTWNKGTKGVMPGKSSDPAIEAERCRKISVARKGMKFTEEHKQHLSDAKTRTGPNFLWKCWYEGKSGLRVCMHSSWEVKFAQCLDKWKIKWSYESRKFIVGKGKYPGRVYTPDFYLPEFDLYVEIKGYLRKDNKRKLQQFRKKYPDTRWMLLQKDDLEMLGIFDTTKVLHRKRVRPTFQSTTLGPE